MDLMQEMLAKAPVVHDDGHFISAEVSRIVELIREYDTRLDVKWIPPEHRLDGDPAFTVIERSSDGQEFIVFYVQSEEEFNASILTRIYMADVQHNDVQGRIEAQNRAVKAADAKREADIMEEQHRLMHSVLKSPKHTYKHNGKTYRK